MTNQGSIKTLLLCCLFGTASGVLSAWLFNEVSRSPSPAQAQAESSPDEPGVRSFAAPRSVSDPRIAALEAKVAALSNRASAESEDEPGEDRPPPHDLPRLRAEQAAHWQDLLDGVNEEPVRPAFSVRATDSFERNLNQLAKEHDFSLSSVHCHSTRCTAELKWPSFRKATERFTVLLQHGYELNCATRTLLPEPAGRETDPYVSTMVFDCSELEAQP
jgi:hypothetical protein